MGTSTMSLNEFLGDWYRTHVWVRVGEIVGWSEGEKIGDRVGSGVGRRKKYVGDKVGLAVGVGRKILTVPVTATLPEH
jgi:hypothetical protein